MRSSIMFMILALLFTIVFGQTWKEKKDSHFENLAETNAFSLSNANYFANTLKDENNFRFNLENILIVRTIGSQGHDKVRKFIVKSMKNLGWNVKEQKFNSPTPHGNKNFTNIIATLNPDAPRQLVLACHYDSKIEPIGFLGATDSAVPCAQMINLAFTLRNDLQKNKYNDVSLQFLFFDGEEAFVNWNDKDSIYGSRYMAQNWQKERFSFGNAIGNTLDRIDLFVLLDLLGTKSPKIYNYFTRTSNWFALMQHIEDTLASDGYLTTKDRIFGDRQGNFGIEDDHIPFLRRGVPILHLIPVPFPKVWHTIDDNLKAIDFDTVSDLNKMLRLFVATYLNLT